MLIKKSQWFLWANLFFIGGVAFSGITAMPFFICYVAFVFTITIVIVLRGKFAFLFILFLFFLLGVFRYELSRPKKIIFDEQKTISFKGLIIEEPETKNNYQNLIVKTEDDGIKALLKSNIYPKYFYGQKIKIKCAPKPVDYTAKYGRYLACSKIKFICYYPNIELLSGGIKKGFKKNILSFKRRGKEIIEKSLPAPEAQILSAMLLGYKKNISPQWREKFSQAGISHIIAISGMHLAIISFILTYFLIRVGFWRKQAFYITVLLLWIFIIIIGAPASAMRAGIMISVVLWAGYLGRINNMFNILLLTASFLLLINPLLLFGDVGFQLSFLAISGIMYLAPVLSFWLRKIPDFLGIKKILIATLAAQIATLPLSVYYFGNIPILALPVNLLIIPILPVVLCLGIAIIGSGFIWMGVAKFFGWVVWPFLNSLLKIVDIFLFLPFSYFHMERIDFIPVFWCYVLIGYFFYRKKRRRELEMFWE